MNMDAMDEIYSQDDMEAEPFPLDEIYKDPNFLARVDALAVKEIEKRMVWYHHFKNGAPFLNA